MTKRSPEYYFKMQDRWVGVSALGLGGFAALVLLGRNLERDDALLVGELSAFTVAFGLAMAFMNWRKRTTV